MAVNWGLGLAPDVGSHVFNAFQQGQEAKQKDMARNALTAYATDPTDANLNGLAAYQPEFVIQQRQQQQAQQAKQAEQKLIGDALTGNPDARKQLAYVNSDMYMKLDENHKKAVDGLMQNIGQTAFSILQLPPEQQGPALDQALAGFKAQGIDTSGFVRTGNPRQDLMTALAITGQLDEWEKFQQPTYTAKTEFGMFGSQFGRPLMEGGQVKDFAPPPSLQAGAVVDGYRYKGGNPNDKASWEPAGGASGNTGGPFRPVGNGVSVIKSLFPKAQVTSGYRPGGRKESWHTQSKGAVDIAPIPGMTFDQYVQKVRGAGYNIIEAIDEVNHPSKWSTGPHWHIVIGER